MRRGNILCEIIAAAAACGRKSGSQGDRRCHDALKALIKSMYAAGKTVAVREKRELFTQVSKFMELFAIDEAKFFRVCTN